MRLQTVRAWQGASWLKQGFRAFRARPMSFAALFASFMFGVLILTLLPFIGPLLVFTLLPTVSLAFMIATRRVVEGGTPTPLVFTEPLQAPRPRLIALLWLGVIYTVATFAVMALGDLLDGGAFETLMDAIPSGQNASEVMAARVTAPGVVSGMLMRFGLAGLLALPFWHAPALVFWQGQGCAQALFTSSLACWRNLGAFVVYGLAWIGLILAVAVLGSLLFALIGEPQLFAVAGVPLSLLFTTVFYASLYFTYADCFAPDEPVALSPASHHVN
jgi:hypothetical protein